MKYLALDLETTGLRPGTDQVLQLSMVVEDSAKNTDLRELPHFTCFIKHDEIIGQPFALAMNSWILNIISGRNLGSYPILSPTEAEAKCLEFLDLHFGSDRITVAGKNVAGFDIPFLPESIRSLFRHRVIDPGSMFIDWNKDRAAPDLSACNVRAGLDSNVYHDAYQDALAIVALLRTTY